MLSLIISSIIIIFLGLPILVIFGAFLWHFLITPTWEYFWAPIFRGKLPWND